MKLAPFDEPTYTVACPRQTCLPSDAAHIPELRETLQHVGDVMAECGRQPCEPNRPVGHAPECLELDLHRDLLLCRQVLGVEPCLAQLFDPGIVGPAWICVL